MFRFNLRQTILTLATAIFALSFFFHPLKPAYACSCVQPGPPVQARDEAQSVFAGTVSAISGEGNGLLVTFDVEQFWKGPEGPQLTILTSNNSASCGVEFVEGEKYLVYGFSQDGRLSTNLCSRTTTFANANNDLAALGAGTPAPVEASTPQTEVSTGLPWLPFALGGAGLAVVIIGAVVIARRRAR
jgi:hypothetical protein